MAFLDFLTGITNGIKTFIDNTPKPVKFIFFLIFILLLGGLINSSLNVFGVYCDSNDNPVKVSLASGVALIGKVPDYELLNSNQVKLNKVFLTSEDKHTDCSVLLTEGTVTFEDETTTDIKDIEGGVWVYDGAYCTDCEEVRIKNSDVGLLSNVNAGDLASGVCWGDVDRKINYSNWWKKSVCGSGECEPPINYKYSSDLNRYICVDDSCLSQTGQGQNSGAKWDEELKKKGAERFYPEGITNELSDINAVGFVCEDLKPKLTFFGIEVFNYRYWILIMVISVMMYFLFKFKRSD